MTDEQEQARERVAIEVEHHEPAYAQVIYNRRVAEMEKDDEQTNREPRRVMRVRGGRDVFNWELYT